MEVLGLGEQITVVPADTTDPNDSLRQENPLGKIPALVMADGGAIYDSRVILEYLDNLAGGGKLIPNGAERFRVLTRAALADGLLDAAILTIYEQRWRETATHSARWLAHQSGKIERGLATFDSLLDNLHGVDVSTIGLACVLGYLDLRFEGRWRATHPRLVVWLEAFAFSVPAFEKTRP